MKSLRANLYLPLDCLQILENYLNEIEEYFKRNIKQFAYDFGSMEYNEKEVCYFDLYIIGKTISEVKGYYNYIKKYIKYLTKKKPKQIMMFTAEMINI